MNTSVSRGTLASVIVLVMAAVPTDGFGTLDVGSGNLILQIGLGFAAASLFYYRQIGSLLGFGSSSSRISENAPMEKTEPVFFEATTKVISLTSKRTRATTKKTKATKRKTTSSKRRKRA